MNSRQAKVARVVAIETPDNSDSDNAESGGEDEDGKEIQVEFEARSPEEEDYHGIRRLLQQLFLRSPTVNISKVAETVLGQRYLGSVIKQSVGEDTDSDDGVEDPNEVYAVSTVLSLSKEQQNKESVAGLRTFIKEQTAKGGDRQVLTYVTDLLDQNNVGFLLNERFINIPAQITVPLWETLLTEMRKARDRNLPFDFGHYIMICKLYKTKTDNSQDHQAVVFSNPEEELIVSESELCIDYDVSSETDTESGGNWTDGVEMNPWRRIVVFRAEKLEEIIRKVNQAFPSGMTA